MADVTIRRCIFRVVRRRGWSWGREPRQLVNDVVRALPALLAAELQRLLPEEAEGEIAAPLRIDVRIGLPALRSWARGVANEIESAALVEPGGTFEAAQSEGSREIAAALRRGLSGAHLTDRIEVTRSVRTSPDGAGMEPDPQARATTILNVLVTWHSAGHLEPLLWSLSEAAVQAWHRVLLGRRPGPVREADETIPPDAVALLDACSPRARGATSLERARLRLLVTARLAAEAGAQPTDRAVRDAIDEAIANPVEEEPQSIPAPVKSIQSRTNVRADVGYETRVASALPFLLLGPLHRTGWIDLAEATFAGAELEAALPALAAALATKVLPEPERGWRRTPDTVRAAATFAGDAMPRPDEDIVSVARTAAPLMPALNAIVRRSLIDGRRPGDPLLVCAVDDVRLIVDPSGVFLLSGEDSHETLAAHLREANTAVFVPEEDADVRMLRALDAAQVTFVTPARPVRGERWTAVPATRAPRLYSNHRVSRLVAPRAEAAARARDIWQAFARRPLPGRPQDPALDRAVSLAAALALGTIAWELWRSRESTDPVLALERFGDLDASVRFEHHQVRVRVPIGKRFRDLKDAGLLAAVPRVPWLGFRSVVFAGG